MVMREGPIGRPALAGNGTGQLWQAGSALPVGLANRLGLTAALGQALAPTPACRPAHDAGVVLRDLIVTLAHGSVCLADPGALGDRSDLYGSCLARHGPARDLIDRGRPAGSAARGDRQRAWARL